MLRHMSLKNTLIEGNVEINNALVKKISLTHDVANSLEISKLFEDSNSHDNTSD